MIWFCCNASTPQFSMQLSLLRKVIQKENVYRKNYNLRTVFHHIDCLLYFSFFRNILYILSAYQYTINWYYKTNNAFNDIVISLKIKDIQGIDTRVKRLLETNKDHIKYLHKSFYKINMIMIFFIVFSLTIIILLILENRMFCN